MAQELKVNHNRFGDTDVRWYFADADEYREELWANVQDKCRQMAEEYK